MIHGTSIVLYERTQTGTDGFGDPVWQETPVTVENVLIGEPASSEITTSTDTYGKTLAYMLGIPKGDTHVWEDRRVEFFGESFRTFGNVIQGIESNVPGPWHKKIRVARYGTDGV